MIPFLSNYLSKSKCAWLAHQERLLRDEFAPQLQTFRDAYARQLEELNTQGTALQAKFQALQQLQAQCEAQDVILQDRRVAVEKANEELRTQLRLLEAKASPDSVWVEAFSRGFEKAWDAMWPIMSSGVAGMKALIEQQAIDATLERLDQTVLTRAEALGQVQVREKQDLLAKQQEFTSKRDTAKLPADKERYSHYLTALDWILYANGVHSDQPTTE